MRSGDTPVEMVLYPGGDHHMVEQGKPSFRVDYVTRLTDWVQRWTTPSADDHDATAEESKVAPATAEVRERSTA
jgi:hypothetical protein